MATEPVSRPVAVGANFTWKVVDAPGASDVTAGWLTMLKLEPTARTAGLPNVIVARPSLVSVNVWTLLVPTVVEPKSVPLAVRSVELEAIPVRSSLTTSWGYFTAVPGSEPISIESAITSPPALLVIVTLSVLELIFTSPRICQPATTDPLGAIDWLALPLPTGVPPS